MSTTAFESIDPPTSVLDTAPHPSLVRYSDGNYGEVAPPHVSPLAWSAMGPPVERAFRGLYTSLAPALQPLLERPYFAFVAYIGAKPYHNVDGILSIVPFVPGLRAEDVTSAYLGDLPTSWWSPRHRPRIEQAAVLARAARRLTDLPRLIDAVEVSVRHAEDLAGDGIPLTPATYRLVRRTLDHAWQAHIDATSFAALAIGWSARLGRSLGDEWMLLRGTVLQPDDVVWTSLKGAGTRDAAFLTHPYYEIGDMDPALPTPAAPATQAPVRDGAGPRPLDSDRLWHAVVQEMPSSARSALRLVAAQAQRLMEDRERTKMLAMRAMHVARAMAAERGRRDAGSGWSGCTLAEIAAGRAAEGSARLRVYEELRSRPIRRNVTTIASANHVAPAATPIGVAAGSAAGMVTHGEGAGEILVLERADSTLIAELQLASAVVCERGSFLSHVAIICRSLGIPAVVNVTDARARFPEGSMVEVDGSAGIVRRVG